MSEWCEQSSKYTSKWSITYIPIVRGSGPQCKPRKRNLEKEKKANKRKRIVEWPKTNGRPEAFANYGHKPIQILMREKE